MQNQQNEISLLPWYSNGKLQNDIGDLANQLTSIVNENSEKIESKEVIQDIAIKWTDRKQATLYLIVSDLKQVIGTIALSPVLDNKHHARIGYLIGKQYEDHGFEALAVEKLLAIVKKKGFIKVSASLPNGDLFCIQPWKELGLTVDIY